MTMIMKLTTDMTLEERLAVQNSNNKFLHTYYIDYPIECGTDGIWTYEKKASGIAECWGKYTASGVNVAKNNYSGFYYSAGIDVPLPFEFITIDDFQVNGGSMDRVNFARMFGVTSSAVTFIICGHDGTATSANITVYISVKGRWKEE